MSDQTGMGQVKFQVRHNALMLREFTVDNMVRATGLNPESVRTELQRMKRERLLTSQPHPDPPKKRGGRPALYRLTDEPEARLALSESIEAFYPPLPPADRPTSRHYLWAQRLLNRAQTADEPQRSQLLSEAERDLEMAEHAEGGSLAPEPVKAYLQYERARLAYLCGEYEEAEEICETLRAFFVSAQDETMIRHIDELRLCLKTWGRFEAEKPSGVDETALTRCLLDTLAGNAYLGDSPLTSLSLQLLDRLSEPVDEGLSDFAWFSRSKGTTVPVSGPWTVVHGEHHAKSQRAVDEKTRLAETVRKAASSILSGGLALASLALGRFTPTTFWQGARLLVFLLWGLVLISLILALFKSLMIWVPALLVALAVVYSLLLRTLLYQPSENHLGVIYRFDHLWRLVGPNERAIVIPGVDEVWAEISLNPRRVEVSLSDLWTKDLASINCELQVYYQLDLRRARADFLPQALRIPDDGWNSIIRTVLQEIASETVSSTILDELFSPAGRGDFKLALSKLLADRLKNLGLVVHPQSGVSVQAVMPEDTMWQAMVHRAASAATLPGEAALTRLRPILEELSRQHPEVAWEVLLEEWAATAVRQLEELSQKPPEVAWETILLEAVTVAA